MQLATQHNPFNGSGPAPHGSDFALQNLRGSRILIVEDEYLLARNLSQTFEQIGVNILGPVPTIQRAMPLLARADAAVLDIDLNGIPVFPLADLLDRNRTPFVFFTGCSDIVVPERFRYVRNLPKPADVRDIVSSLASSCNASEHVCGETESVMETIPSLRLAARLMISDEAAADRLVERTFLRAIESVATKEDGTVTLGWLLTLLEDVRREEGQFCLN
ncbi:response regulator [Martelella sp.]|uniref:response regulator n=1 Tax=Martelella sp. TaxID=1969699 RepID=UPI0032430046